MLCWQAIAAKLVISLLGDNPYGGPASSRVFALEVWIFCSWWEFFVWAHREIEKRKTNCSWSSIQTAAGDGTVVINDTRIRRFLFFMIHKKIILVSRTRFRWQLAQLTRLAALLHARLTARAGTLGRSQFSHLCIHTRKRLRLRVFLVKKRFSTRGRLVQLCTWSKCHCYRKFNHHRFMTLGVPSGWPTDGDKHFHRRPGVWSGSKHNASLRHRIVRRTGGVTI